MQPQQCAGQCSRVPWVNAQLFALCNASIAIAAIIFVMGGGNLPLIKNKKEEEDGNIKTRRQ